MASVESAVDKEVVKGKIRATKAKLASKRAAELAELKGVDLSLAPH